MVGIIYEQAARDYLKRRYPSVDESQISDLLSHNSFKEIESLIGIQNLIKVGIAAIRSSLKIEGIQLPSDFEKIVLFSRNSNEDYFNRIARQVFDKNLSYNKKIRINLSAISAVHKQWRRENRAKFYNPKFADRKFMFLPIELIGYCEVVKYYMLVRRILACIGLRIDPWDLSSAYLELQKKYIATHKSLENAIAVELPGISKNEAVIIANQAKSTFMVTII